MVVMMKPQVLCVLLGVASSAGAFGVHPAVVSNKKLPSALFAAAEPPSLSSSSLYGGDYAGLSASFDATTGKVLPLPEHYVPEALLEWGTTPTSWEVIVSEEGELKRQTLEILPAVGCGVDNLDTNKKEETLEVTSLQVGDGLAAFDSPVGDDGVTTRAETVFGLSDNHRLRVVFDVTCTDDDFSIQSPITINMERLASTESSEGNMAAGGGLTGSKVSEMIGPRVLKTPHFCNQAPLEWQPPGVKVLNLPGNVTIATSHEGPPWMLDIVYVSVNDKGEAEKQIVRRSYYPASTKQPA